MDSDIFNSKSGSICVACKGTKLLCGKERCPILIKLYSQQKIKQVLNSNEILGSSPPGVFVGSYGYPKVFIGPLIPPKIGDTSILDTPEEWVGKKIDEIVDFRFSLIRGKILVNVKNLENAPKIINEIRESVLSESSLDIEAKFKNKPSGNIILNDDIQPFGPSAYIKEIKYYSESKTNKKLEKTYYDSDLNAKDAILYLYENNVLISKIQKALSVGLLGIEKKRKLVPTRWAITAVDSLISKNLIENTKRFPIINEFRIYNFENLDNNWIIIFLPTNWCYELIEAWWPGTVWNPNGKNIWIVSSHEFYEGKKEYAEIGGCYYAARLAVNELLNKEKRQAGVVILRESRPGYIMPVGVWNVRESVRAALKTKPINFNSIKEVFDFINKKMNIKLNKWIEKSAILKYFTRQKKLKEFIKN
ncbi:MAG: Nre family DNA repair protein [Candidatus Aenigmatarchaeota archaeon]|nr:Nre family DNA repair protein [Candidatus Aenigmarchaeota archaeon]